MGKFLEKKHKYGKKSTWTKRSEDVRIFRASLKIFQGNEI